MLLTKKHKSLLMIPVFLLSSLILAGFGDSGDAKAYESPHVIKVEDNLLTVKIKELPLKKVMTEIANQTGIKIVLYGEAKKLLSADLSAFPLDKGLMRLTRGISCVLIYGPKKAKTGEPEIREIIIYPKTSEKAGVCKAASIIDPNKRDQEDLKETSPKLPPEPPENEVPGAGEEIVGPALDAKRAKKDLDRLTEVLLEGEDEEVRAGAARSLGDSGDKRAIDPLIAALRDKDPLVREGAVQALGRIGGPKVIPALGEALKDKDKGVREAAVEALKVAEN